MSKNLPLIAHVGIAVKDLNIAKQVYSTILGREIDSQEDVAGDHVQVAIFAGAGDEGKIELVSATSSQSPIARFIERKGAGLHHLCVYCDNIESKLAALKLAGVRLIDEKPRTGAEGKRIAFIHPESTDGVLIELQER